MNVAVVAVPKTNCQRKYRLIVKLVLVATMPEAGVVDPLILPEVAPVMSAKEPSKFVAACCALSVTVPLLENR